jgi:hypothetical protein
MFSKKTTKISLSIWRYVVSVKLMVKILSIFVAFLENMNFTSIFLFSTSMDNSEATQKKATQWNKHICMYISGIRARPQTMKLRKK